MIVILCVCGMRTQLDITMVVIVIITVMYQHGFIKP